MTPRDKIDQPNEQTVRKKAAHEPKGPSAMEVGRIDRQSAEHIRSLTEHYAKIHKRIMLEELERVRHRPLKSRSFALVSVNAYLIGARIASSLFVDWFLSLAMLRRGGHLVHPPGRGLIAALRFLMPRKSFERLIGQAFADELDEYFEALDDRRKWHASWIHIRLYIVVGFTVLAWVLAAAGKRFSQLWKLL